MKKITILSAVAGLTILAATAVQAQAGGALDVLQGYAAAPAPNAPVAKAEVVRGFSKDYMEPFETPAPDKIVKEADAGGFRFNDISYKVTTRDGLPVSGVSISYNLQSFKLTAIDGSGFIPVPTFPHWVPALDKAGTFGQTGADGTFGIQNVSIESSPKKKPDSLFIFSNGDAHVQCSSAKQVFVDFGSLSVVSKKPDDGNADLCGFSLKHATDLYNTLSLHCVIPLTSKELKTLIEAKCAGNR